MPDHTVSITLQALDHASPNIRLAREELERLLATADQINAASPPPGMPPGLSAPGLSAALSAESALPDLTPLVAAAAALRDDLAAAHVTSSDLSDALAGATVHTDALRSDASALAAQLSALTRQVQVVRVRLAVEDPSGLLGGGVGGQPARDNGGVTPGTDRRRYGGDAP